MSQLLSDPVGALTKYVSYPSVSADSSFKEGVSGARDFATQCLKELGFEWEFREGHFDLQTGSLRADLLDPLDTHDICRVFMFQIGI